MSNSHVFQGDSTNALQTETITPAVDLTFLDPPFNQNKAYSHHQDNMTDAAYWQWMQVICERIYALTSDGGAIYFMQREKNAAQVLQCLTAAGWTFQNLIIWKKMTSAVPSSIKFGKHYQIIAFATKGKRPRVFNKLRIDPPLPANYKHKRKNGMYVTDIWDDIRELTSGYFAGDEALRDESGDRFHKQQAPLALLLRIILSSTQVGDHVLDPFAGTGTTLVVAQQLGRAATGIEIAPENVACIQKRLTNIRDADRLQPYYDDYICTEGLAEIWGKPSETKGTEDVLDLPLFRSSTSE